MAFICAENAKELAAKARISRERNKREHALAIESARNILLNVPTPSALPTARAEAIASGYRSERLEKVRAQLASLDRRISLLIEDASEDTAAALDRLCSAQARLSEQERVLSGTPMPGSLRPRSESRRPRAGSVEPLPE